VTFPTSGLEASPLVLAALGFVVGILGGMFGVGGSLIAGPGLFLLGMRLPFVVGTDLAHIAGKSFVAARHHQALGNVDWKLAGLLAPTTLVGVEIGARTLELLKRTGTTSLVAIAYAILLVALGVFLFVEGTLAFRASESGRARGALARRTARIGPTVELPVAGVRGSLIVIGAIGLATGVLGGLLGGGAGYVRMPALVFLLGVPTRVAVGTDLCEIVLSASVGTLSHAVKGNVDFAVALVMLAGGVLGARLGARITTRVRDVTLRTLFSPFPLLGAILIVVRVHKGEPARPPDASPVQSSPHRGLGPAGSP
jgi:uncharacterized membrane protein YfcA